MALIRAKPIKFQPAGLSDAVDGTNAFPGAMQSLSNLIPSPATAKQWVPRPGSQMLTNFPGLSSPTFVSALLTVGSIAYGMVSSSLFAGKDQPFAYNFVTNTLLSITNPPNTLLYPTSTATTGNWTPPIMAQVAGRIMVTHPGFATGSGIYIGWFDVSGFTSSSITGSTHTSTTIDTLSSNALQAGWQVGMTVTGSGVQANTTIVSIASNGLSMVISLPTTTSATAVALTVAGGTLTNPLWGAGQLNGALPFSGGPPCRSRSSSAGPTTPARRPRPRPG